MNGLPEELLRRARDGDASQLGELLDLYRNYLYLLAASQSAARSRRADVSDVVQEALLEAYRDFAQFQGKSEGELIVWLRQILVRNLTDMARHHGAQRRDWRRQQSLEAALERSNSQLQQALGQFGSTPSKQAARRELSVLLSDAVAELPEHYQQVIVLRHIHQLSFSEIAQRMARSPGAVRMLWVRALEQLRASLRNFM